MPDNLERIRGIALELSAHLPLDTDDAMAVIEHMEQLIEWRRRGNVIALKTGRWLDAEQPKLEVVVPFVD